MNNVLNEWDNASKEWIGSLEANNYRSQVLMPETLKMLGDVKGKRLLDLGCGEGGYSRLLSSLGASVAGVDYSKKLISEAVRKNTANEIEYHVSDACRLDGIGDESFDVIVSAMCLIAIKNFEAAIREAYRVLKPGGDFVISILHPCFQSLDYFNEGPFQDSFSDYLGKQLTFWHRMLSTTVNCMIKTGFRLEQLSEPPLFNYNKDEKNPLFLLLKLKK